LSARVLVSAVAAVEAVGAGEAGVVAAVLHLAHAGIDDAEQRDVGALRERAAAGGQQQGDDGAQFEGWVHVDLRK
jgi:hypothetical protein